MALSLDFTSEAGPPCEAAEAALRNAEFIAPRLVRIERWKPRAAAPDAAATTG